MDGFVPITHAHAEEDMPMFQLEPVEYRPNGLKYMTVSNDILVMALSNPRIFN